MALDKVKKYFKEYSIDNRIIELSIEELEKYSNYKEWIDVCKLI